MKKIFASLSLLILISCTSRKENNTEPQDNVPEALQESELVSYKKRAAEDLVEELYREKVGSTPSLQAIEKMIGKLKDAGEDSLQIFRDFKIKNKHYYSSASSHLGFVKDSLLRKEIEAILEKSMTAYNDKISGLNNLEAIVNEKSVSIHDRHTIIMILISLGMISDYQQGNLPSSKPVKSVIDNYNQLVQKMDSVISKNK